MATITRLWEIGDTTGTTNIKFRYRLYGDTTWVSIILGPAIREYAFTGDNNRLYDMQLVNINGSTNPASVIIQAIGFSDPTPLFSPTNTTVGLSFNNLSVDIDSYTAVISEYATPGVPIETNVIYPTTYPEVMTTSFTGLDPLTKYQVTVTPAANQFSDIFTYTFITEEVATCAAPSNTTATLI